MSEPEGVAPSSRPTLMTAGGGSQVARPARTRTSTASTLPVVGFYKAMRVAPEQEGDAERVERAPPRD